MKDLVVFLDIDGVLHPFFPRGDRTDAENQYFSYLKNFEDTIKNIIIKNNISIHIVISSSWRIDKSLDQIRSYFSSEIAEMIIDVTPEINDEDIYAGLREYEAAEWLLSNPKFKHWVALDDMGVFWLSKHKLVLCDDGFRELEIADMIEKSYSVINH
jgi:hypothetical protein